MCNLKAARYSSKKSLTCENIKQNHSIKSKVEKESGNVTKFVFKLRLITKSIKLCI